MTSEERNSAAVANLESVRTVVRFLARRLPQNWAAEDLRGWGNLALLKALENYRPGRGRTMESYVRYKVRFGVIDSLRALERKRRFTDPPYFEGLPEDLPVADSTAPDPVAATLRREVWDAVEQLPPRWRTLLRLHYEQGCTMRECAAALGVNQSRASAIHKSALRRLRGVLAA